MPGEHGTGFWGKHGSHPASLLLLPGHWEAKPGTSNHSLRLSLKVQRVLFFLYYFWKGLVPTPLFHSQP